MSPCYVLFGGRTPKFCLIALFLVVGALWMQATDESTTKPARPTYVVGNIPDVSSWGDRPISFQLRAGEDLKAVFSVVAEPHQVGELGIDQNTGIFTYNPAPEDKANFRLTFEAHLTSDAREEVRTQTISVIRWP